MLPRLRTNLDPSTPITVISGARSWVDAINSKRLGKRTGDFIKEARPKEAYVGVELVPDTGHHVHAERPHEFNRIVKEVLANVDSGGGDRNKLERH
jgi:pimeloyl-ACP methyl ester carboxylesterase